MWMDTPVRFGNNGAGFARCTVPKPIPAMQTSRRVAATSAHVSWGNRPPLFRANGIDGPYDRLDLRTICAFERLSRLDIGVTRHRLEIHRTKCFLQRGRRCLRIADDAYLLGILKRIAQDLPSHGRSASRIDDKTLAWLVARRTAACVPIHTLGPCPSRPAKESGISLRRRIQPLPRAFA